jgi:protein O-GlcNAc transferase
MARTPNRKQRRAAKKKNGREVSIAAALARIDIDRADAPVADRGGTGRVAAARHNRKGRALQGRGKHEEALACFDQALAVKPDDAEAHFHRGASLRQLGRHAEALASYDRALTLKPRYAEAFFNKANLLSALGRLQDAMASYDQALALKPDYAKAYLGRGNVLSSLGQLYDAVASFDQALSHNPDYTDAHINKGIALASLGRPHEALASYDRALDLEPDHSDAYLNKGIVFVSLGRIHDAAASYDRAIELDPKSVKAHNNKGNLMAGLGHPDEAIACYKFALDINPAHQSAAAPYLFQLQHVCAWREFEQWEPRVDAFTKESVRKNTDIAVAPFSHISRVDDPAENLAVARAWSQRIARRLSDQRMTHSVAERKSADSRITLGYLSSDLYDHPTAHLMLRLFALHDRDAYRVHTFSYGKDDGSLYRKRVERDSDRFIDIRNAGHAEAAKQISESGVDILIDLKGHTANNRLEIAALGPAPVQVTYLGFPGTSGADFFDYVLTDPIVTPQSHAPYYTEKLAYLPHCYQVNDDTQAISASSPKRKEVGLPARGIVFCAFNVAYKIEPVIFDVWMELLRQVPDSVLWLYRSNKSAARNLKREAKARGIDAGRLVFADRLPKDEHLARLRLADLALDTRICGGHTTTSDALWAGVPVVALMGNHFASRVSSSLLVNMGLPELVTDSLHDYEALALRLARDPAELEALRAKLARNRETEPLFDTPRFVRNLETAYRQMWELYLAGEEPRQLDVVEA